MTKQTKKINLALQGGGAHGAFAWGIIDYLLQDGRLEIDSISSTSAGSMNAVVIAQGMINNGPEGARELLTQFWRNVSEIGELFSPVQTNYYETLFKAQPDFYSSYILFNLVTKIFSPYEFNPLNFNPLRYILEKNIDFNKIRKSKKIKLFMCATNVRTGKAKIFSNQEISVDAVLASACLPYLTQAVMIEGEYYWDGGYMGNPAIFPIIYHSNVNDILIIHINPIIRAEIPTTSAEIINRINEISFNSSLIREIRAIAFVTHLLEKNWIKPEYRHNLKKIHVHSIRNDKLMTQFSVASKFKTDWVFLNDLFTLGQQTAKEWLEQHYDQIGNETSINFEEFTDK